MNLLERARREGNPVLTGNYATFVWRGDDPPRVISDLNGWQYATGTVFEQADEGLWAANVIVPAGAYIEYALVRSSEPSGRVADPLNRRRIWNGLNAYNHSFYTRPASATRLARRRPRSAAGTLTRLRLPAAFLGERRLRDVVLYAPPNAVEAVPLVIVWDGTDYERRARLPVIVDNLINAGRIRPVALAMIANGRGARLVEYLESSATVGWVERVLLPVANEHLKLIDPARHPGAWGVMGASLGGLMALYTGLRFGHIFGHVLAQSASVHLSAFGQRSHVWALAADRSLPSIRIWQDVGTLEGLLDVNRELRKVLAASQHVTAYYEATSGHNYTAWSNSLWRGLEMLFGEKRLL